VPVEPGSVAQVDLVVADDDTSTHFRSGEVSVLATPRVIALCEEATMLAIHGQMQPNETTVGMQVQIDHLAPTAVGATVTAEAKVEEVHGRRITFKVSARDERGLIAAGRVTRVVVDRERFLDKTR
jgi:fluoroacetyl-CoA thioesterase